ncbi:MAG: FAD-dependent tricarballylate dehydrogenase TcuA, partial [Candidatus Dormiibacterota bacterium]
MSVRPDVLVVGGGNAGFCAARAARQAGASVLLLEKAAEPQAGGNSFYTAGAFRTVHDGVPDLTPLLDRDECDRLGQTDLEPYTEDQFRGDLDRVTDGRTDPAMAPVLVRESRGTVEWLARQGIHWRLMYERQAYLRGGRYGFFGGLALGTVGGGKGLLADHRRAAAGAGIDVRYGAPVTRLVGDADRVRGVLVGERETVTASAVILTSGGFEADPERRARHLGEGWDRAFVRGTPTNTGEVQESALELGAAGHGDWTSCHSVAWDAGAPRGGGERRLTNQLTRQSYPLGIVVNRDGSRFLDEGADFRNYTYARYGREILRQPGGVAYQLFDAKTRPLLRSEEYDSSPITGAEAATIDELADALGIEPRGLAATVTAFNAAIAGGPFDPAVKDGRRADVEPPKSNWAQALDSPPYYGYAVACGISFTFGGLHV